MENGHRLLATNYRPTRSELWFLNNDLVLCLKCYILQYLLLLPFLDHFEFSLLNFVLSLLECGIGLVFPITVFKPVSSCRLEVEGEATLSFGPDLGRILPLLINFKVKQRSDKSTLSLPITLTFFMKLALLLSDTSLKLRAY